jgi:porphobilinogen synthase
MPPANPEPWQQGQVARGTFPTVRLRRLRQNPLVRQLVQETRLHPRDLVLPMFVRSGVNLRHPIPSMPGHFQYSLDTFEQEIRTNFAARLGGILLFGVPAYKDNTGKEALSDEGIIQRAVRVAKQAAPNLMIITDVCLCEYMEHGHCGVVVKSPGGKYEVDNDASLDLLAREAVSHARSGADMVAPSAMMDGQVGAIRTALDQANFSHVPIMSYAAKYASAFYGPFREAAQSTPQFGDRRSYQMDPAGRAAEAMREIELDLAEGADIIMVKPALAYLDIVRQAADRFPQVPLAAYNVSGEYAMIKAAAAQGWIDERATAFETLTAIRRAGASIILTYWARDVLRWMS